MNSNASTLTSPNMEKTLFAQSINELGLRLVTTKESDTTATEEHLDTTKVYNLSQVVVTGTGVHRRAENSPVPIRVITAEELKEANITNFKDALDKLESSFSFQTNSMGTFITMNGLSEDYIVFMINGQKVSSGGFGSIDFDRIDIGNIKRIEILDGAASSLYGSDAIAGVVNIITDESKTGINASSYTGITNEGRFNESVSLDIKEGIFGSYTSYQRQQADSWQLSALKASDKNGVFTTDSTGSVASVGYFSNNVSQKFTFDITKALSFEIHGSYFNYETRRPRETIDNAYKYNLLHTSYTYGAGLKYQINKSDFIEAKFYADNFDADWKYFVKNHLDKDSIQNRQRSRYYNASVKGYFQLGEHNNLSVGFEYVLDYLGKNASYTFNRDHYSVYTIALFAQDEIDFNEHFKGVVGVRYIHNENFKSSGTQNFSLLYKTGGFSLRGSYAAGYSTPKLSYMYGVSTSSSKKRYTIGNPDLKAEKSNYVSLNAGYHNRYMDISATGYFNKLQDMMTFLPVADTTGLHEKWHLDNDGYEIQQYDNINEARVAGCNITLRLYPVEGLALTAAYSFAHDKNLSAEKGESDRLDKTTRHAGKMSADWHRTWNFYTLNVGVNGVIFGHRYYETYNDPESSLYPYRNSPRYNLWDLNTTHTFALKHFTLEPGVGIYNIFDYRDSRPYNSNYATLTPGRSFYGTLRIRFGS